MACSRQYIGEPGLYHHPEGLSHQPSLLHPPRDKKAHLSRQDDYSWNWHGSSCKCAYCQSGSCDVWIQECLFRVFLYFYSAVWWGDSFRRSGRLQVSLHERGLGKVDCPEDDGRRPRHLLSVSQGSHPFPGCPHIRNKKGKGAISRAVKFCLGRSCRKCARYI